MAIYAVQYTYDDRADLRDELRPEHRAYLAGVADQGHLLVSGPYADGEPGALLILRVDDEESLADILAADPFARAGLITATTHRTWDPILGPWARTS